MSVNRIFNVLLLYLGVLGLREGDNAVNKTPSKIARGSYEEEGAKRFSFFKNQLRTYISGVKREGSFSATYRVRVSNPLMLASRTLQ